MDPQELETMRHSASHLLAQAVLALFPGTQLAIGPAIKDGFYYDFDTETVFTPEDLPRIEKKMKEIIGQNYPFQRQEYSKEEARKLFTQLNQPYKLELINEIPDEKVTIYKDGDFVDLCRGPHVASTKEVKAIKLLTIAGAYWRGNEKNKMLQRIYGTAFPSKEELDHYLLVLEEAKKRDHRKLGRELELFSMDEEVGAGLVIYHPKGALLRMLIEDYEKKEHLKRGYQMVIGPHVLKADVWKESGHYDYYRENMFFFEIEDQEYGIKPMNCPGHIIVYRSRLRSYKELPLRFFELGTVYRYEKSGVLHGLLRVRGFTQDDAHIFCLPDQLEEEIGKVVDFVFETLKVFGFDRYQIEVSTRPEKSIGADEDWQRAQNALEGALKSQGIAYAIHEGEGAFYGPKIDIKLEDALGRAWQCATVQCDFALPQRFNLTYIGEDGKEYRPVMLHRVLLGSLERFLGTLIEHYAGAFPVWLSPVQVKIVPISAQWIDYAREVETKLKAVDIRVEVDERSQTMGYKIRQAELEKVPYILVLGQKEQQEGSVCIRRRKVKEQQTVSLDACIKAILEDIQQKK